jgi:hypothetical protein
LLAHRFASFQEIRHDDQGDDHGEKSGSTRRHREGDSERGACMKIRMIAALLMALGVFAVARAQTSAAHPSGGRVFEIRTYTTAQELDVFMNFFRENTVKLFKKHGFEPVGYWVPTDAPKSSNTVVYMLAFPDRETAKARWDAFFKDPDWIKARTEFMAKHGRLTEKIESVFVQAIDFLPLK